MVFFKKGEHIELNAAAIQDTSSVIPVIDDKILDSMRKYAANLNRIAPKAEDFLYFAAVMMHSAEAALINEDGTAKLTAHGEPVHAHWDTSEGTWRWICSDPNVKPFKNANGDIFPEVELIKAHKKWKEKPLCIDHKSNSVDHTRGLIVDTYYDRALKRVIALCALDKANYPELAKKVSTGMSNSVSMGTGVGRAICFDCGRVARVEADFCGHMQTKSGYGEINIDLSPIELSIVVNGADPYAKIKHIIASANAMSRYISQKEVEMGTLGKTTIASEGGVSKIKQDLEDALKELAVLETSLKETTQDADGPTNSTVAMDSTETEATDFSLAPPQQRFAENDEGLANKLTLLKEAINRQLKELSKMSRELSNFTKQITGNEETMSGKTDNLKSQAYFQGGGGANEPTPGQAKYPKDPMNEDLREKEDKQMVGQVPFPEVGDVEGMHPSPASVETKDELKRKELLQRASLKAKFVKATKSDGSNDFAKSAWQVWDGEKLLLTATVNEITGGRADSLYSAIATESFAKDLMSKVRAYGADKTAAMFKSAQLPPSPMSAAPEMPALPGGELDKGDKDMGTDGDPKDKALSLAEEIRDRASDMVEAVKALTGEQAELGSETGSAPELSAADDSKVSTAVLHNMRKDLNSGLTSAFNEVLAEFRSTENDLSTLVAMYEGGVVNGENQKFINTIAEETFANANKNLDLSAELLASFAIYARGTEIITKSADNNGVEMPTAGTDLMSMIDSTNKEIEAVAQMMEAPEAADASDSLHSMLADDLATLDIEAAEDANDAVMTSDPAKAAELAKKDPSLQVKLTEASTKADRFALRAKLASEVKWNPILQDAHPKGKATTALDVKPEGDLAVVEDLEEAHDKMYDVATAPAKVRKEAEEIQQLVAEGKLNPKTDLDILIANGVDPETVKYWKQYYGQVEQGGAFAAEMLKEHAKAKMEEEMNTYRVKLARAYELTYEMVDRDLLSHDREAIAKNVSELMLINDEGFESYKKVVARRAPVMDKRASRIPAVGLGSGETFSQSVESEDLATQLAAAFSGSTKRTF